MLDLKIEDNKIYISRTTDVCYGGYMFDLNELSAHKCLILMDKLKRTYFEKLKR